MPYQQPLVTPLWGVIAVRSELEFILFFKISFISRGSDRKETFNIKDLV